MNNATDFGLNPNWFKSDNKLTKKIVTIGVGGIVLLTVAAIAIAQSGTKNEKEE